MHPNGEIPGLPLRRDCLDTNAGLPMIQLGHFAMFRCIASGQTALRRPDSESPRTLQSALCRSWPSQQSRRVLAAKGVDLSGRKSVGDKPGEKLPKHEAKVLLDLSCALGHAPPSPHRLMIMR